MQEDKKLRKYYRQIQYGGRSSVARVTDYIALRAIFFFACWLWFRYNIPNRTLAVVLSIVTLLMFMIAARLWNSISYEKVVKKHRRKLKQEIALERLILMSAKEFQQLITSLADAGDTDTFVYGIQTVEKVNANAVLLAYQAAQDIRAQHMLICATADFSTEAMALLKRLPIQTECLTKDVLLKRASASCAMEITEEDIDDRIYDAIEMKRQQKSKLQSRPFQKKRATKYILAAVVLMAASFLTGFPIYYRMLSGVCLLLAALTFWINRGTESTIAS